SLPQPNSIAAITAQEKTAYDLLNIKTSLKVNDYENVTVLNRRTNFRLDFPLKFRRQISFIVKKRYDYTPPYSRLLITK
ncbi:MAG: hypothetical protein JW699_00100, partial [Chitinispirillaceae bacterium]|nr:hypothetical protein [Chitinispirillaceae bacterium]